MAVVQAWLGRRSVRTKLAMVVLIALVGLAVSAGVGLKELSATADGAHELETTGQLTRTALEADMAHDAIRGDVLRLLLAADPIQRDEIAGDLTDHSAIMREKLEILRGDAAPAQVREIAEPVLAVIEQYLTSAAAVAQARDQQPVDQVLGGVAYQQFTEAFAAVEQQLPLVGDALAEYATAVSATVDRQRARANMTLTVTAGVAGLLVLLLALLVVRGILGSLREVSSALSAVAAGDLSRRARVAGTDEPALMAQEVNSVISGMRDTIKAISESAMTVATSAEQMTGVSQRLSAGAERATAQAEVTAQAAQAVAGNINTTAAGSEEMGSSIGEISRSASQAVAVVGDAVTMAERTNLIMAELGGSSAEIGSVVKVITSIAEQTNLLALNATIEAARAGDAGKGFAVVAGEVKDLAQETAKATSDIASRVEAMQAGASAAVDAIAQISAVIERINDHQTTIASAVEQQSATANEMTRNMAEAVDRSGEISSAISAIATVASTTEADADAALGTARDLTRMADHLRELVVRFRT